MPTKPQISIIVPVYNIERQLCTCIDSILAQSFKDFELILVNDGSTDNSGNICNQYAKKDKRIKVFHQKNKGVSFARNLGLNEATGDWCCFVDSDDYVLPQYIESMFALICDDAQLIISNIRYVEIIQENITLQEKFAIDYMLNNNLFAFSNPTAKLYNIKIIKESRISFPVGINMGEDAIFLMRYIKEIKLISFCTDINYIPVGHEGRLSSKYYDFSSEFKCFQLWKKANYDVFSQYYSPNEALKLSWNIRAEAQFLRAIHSLYNTSPRLTLRKQINYIKQIPVQEIQEFKLYGKNTLPRKITKLLLSKKLYYILLVISNIQNFISSTFYKK